MKRFKFLILLMFIPMMMNAQVQTEEMVTVPKSQLTTQQLAHLELDNQIKKMEAYGKWVGIGDEIGTAIREGLMGVVDVAENFGETEVGKFTLVMIAWKVMGKDIIRIFLGLVFFIFVTILFFKGYKSTIFPKQILVEDPGLFKYPKKYEVVQSDGDSIGGYEFMKVLYLFCYAGAAGITFAIMFG